MSAYWTLVKADDRKEMHVAESFESQEIETYVPVKITAVKVSRRANISRFNESPMIARCVFVRCLPEDLPTIRYSDGPMRSNGIPWQFPDVQMQTFKAKHSDWIEQQMLPYRVATAKKGKPKPITAKIEAGKSVSPFEQLAALLAASKQGVDTA
jgi:hypothetical protein